MYQWENNENTIVSSALNYKIYSDDYTWTLSHELSHFVLNWKGYPWDVVGGDVHKIHDEYMDCKKIDRTLSICPQLWEIITTTDRDEMKIMKVITTEDYQPEKSIPEKTTPKETTPFSKIGIRFGVAVMDETTKGTIKVFPSLKDARGNLISHPDNYVWIDGENKGWIEPNKWSKSFLANQGSHKIDVATTKFQYAGNFYQSIEATNTMYAEERHIAEESGFSAGVFSGSGGVVTFDSDDSDKKNLYAEPKFITLYINDWGDNQGYLLDDGTVEFIGSVSDEKGNFVSDVEIIIEDMFNQGIVIPTTTDDQGNFFVKWTPVYPEHWTQVLENMEVFQAYVKNNMIINSDNLFILSIINEEESAEEPIETIEESVETIEKPVETIEKHVEEPEPKFCFLWWCWY